ncbi:hypothetical protein BH11CYA1_BH11CYA1_10100 [soil metagenome]
MDSSLISALLGSTIGGVASIIATFVTQDFLAKRAVVAREIVARERLYAQFIKEASNLYFDSLDGNLDNPGGLIPFFSLLGRIKITGNESVQAAAEGVAASIIESYKRPSISFSEMHQEMLERSSRGEVDEPFKGFTDACRHERDELKIKAMLIR